ncbi:MAG: hypothetical protein K1X89_14675 [Myxococcaceae bacterium]|nr:hypothetical protein [Myxococcaceae bacterium]
MSAALTFDRSARTAADLKTFWNADPLAAAKWLATLKNAAAAAVPELDAVTRVLAGHTSDSFKASALRELASQTPRLFELVADYGALQAARTTTVGWSATEQDPWPEAPAFTGTLSLVDGKPTLETTRGSFTLELGSPNWRDEPETAFLGRTVTIKGFPSGDGKALSIEQFGPGSSPDFTSGRILVDHALGKAFIAPNGDVPLGPEAWVAAGLTPPPDAPPNPTPPPKAEITDPAFVKLLLGDAGKGLADYSPAGVILPGKVVLKHGVPVYEHKPRSFYILGRFQHPDVQALPHGKVLHQIETGYFHATDAVAPARLTVADELRPGGKNPNPPGDDTIGGAIAAANGEGRRTFFYVQLLQPDAVVDGADLHNDRRMGVSWIGRASDVGLHGPATTKATTLKDVAMSLPAAAPEEQSFAPNAQPRTRPGK